MISWPKIVRSALMLFIIIILPLFTRAGLFYEHKFIGDSAFKSFIRKNNLERFFKDSLHLSQFGVDIPIPYVKNELVRNYYNGMFAFSDKPASKYVYSYGDLTGLAADHTLDAYQLFKGLFAKALFKEECPGLEKYDVLMEQVRVALQSHFSAIENGKREGNFFSIKYAILADEDQSHFLRPPQVLEEMLTELDTAFLNLSYNLFSYGCATDSKLIYDYRQLFDEKILKINNPTKYALLHAIALHFINYAAVDYNENPDMVEEDIKTAFLFNAFADHFLQDEFAAGHMAVQRNWRGLNNKGTHDYYNRIGLDVTNKNGNNWRTYGDNYYDSLTFHYAIESNIISLQELWDQFEFTRKKVWVEMETGNETPHVSLFDSLRLVKIAQAQFPEQLVKEFKAWQYTPLPLDIKKYGMNKLKSSSKSGGFIDLGYGRGFDFTRTVKNQIFSFGISPIGFLLKEPGKDVYPNIEAIIWVGLGLTFNHVVYDNAYKNQLLLKIPVSLYDRWMMEVAAGGSRYRDKSHIVFISSIGYEWKTLSHFWAPAINYFVSFEKSFLPMQGIKLNIRLY